MSLSGTVCLLSWFASIAFEFHVAYRSYFGVWVIARRHLQYVLDPASLLGIHFDLRLNYQL